MHRVTHLIVRKREPESPKANVLALQEERRRLFVYERAWTDTEAALRLDMLRSTFVEWRRSRGLPRPRMPDAQMYQSSKNEFFVRRAYEASENDEVLAARLETSVQTARARRKAAGLPERAFPTLKVDLPK